MFACYIDETAKQLNKKQKALGSTESSLYESLYDDEDELDLSLFNDMILESRFNSAQELDLSDFEEIPTLNGASPALNTLSAASPRTRRRLQTSQKNLSKEIKDISLSSPSHVPAAFAAQTNWRVVETLMQEVKVRS